MTAQYTKPFYELEIKGLLCSFEIFINAIPVLFNYNSPQYAVDWPINMFLFHTGEQRMLINIRPDEVDLNQNLRPSLEINLFVKEFNQDYYSRELLKKFDIPIVPDTLELKFDVDIPFELQYPETVMPLNDVEEQVLKKEIYTEYLHYFEAIASNDSAKYYQYTKDRFDDICIAHYLNNAQVENYKRGALKIFAGHTLQMLPITDYRLRIVNDQFVFLQLPETPPGLYIKANKGEDEQEIVESAVYFMTTDNKFKLIR